jgi:hypothetical protein
MVFLKKNHVVLCYWHKKMNKGRTERRLNLRSLTGETGKENPDKRASLSKGTEANTVCSHKQFIHSFDKHLLSIYHVPGTFPGIGNTALNTTDRFLPSWS